MLHQDAKSKALFTRLEKVTAATHKKDLDEGKPQNPLSSVHWTLESSPGGYTITMMRSGVIVSQKMLFRQDLFETVAAGGKQIERVNEAAVDAIVKAMFEGVPALAA